MEQILLEHVRAEEKWLKDRTAQLGRIRGELERRFVQARASASDDLALAVKDAAAGAEAYNWTSYR